MTAVNSSGGGQRPPVLGAIESASLKCLTEGAGSIRHDAVVSIVDSALAMLMRSSPHDESLEGRASSGWSAVIGIAEAAGFAIQLSLAERDPA